MALTEAGSDYVESGGHYLILAPGETSKNVSVPVYGDTLVKGMKHFILFSPTQLTRLSAGDAPSAPSSTTMFLTKTHRNHKD